MSHFGGIEHFTGQNLLIPDYVLDGAGSRDDWNEAAITARTDKMLKEVMSILSLRSDK